MEKIIITSLFFVIFNFAISSQETSYIEISCPNRTTQNRNQDIFYVDENVLFRVANSEITEISIPVKGGVFEYLLSPSGDQLAMLIWDNNVVLSIFEINSGTVQNYETSIVLTSVIEFNWIDLNTVKIVEKLSDNHIKIHTLNIDQEELTSEIMTIPINLDSRQYNYRFSPDLMSFAVETEDVFTIANLAGELLYTTDLFDYYSTLSSIAWSYSSEELIMITTEWQILNLNTQETQVIQIPNSYEFLDATWSPDNIHIAFLGVRLPRERPNALSEIIVYDRSQDTFIDLCQSGRFAINGIPNEMYWSSNGIWIAYIMETLEGWNLYAIDFENNTVDQIELDPSGSVPQLLGWR